MIRLKSNVFRYQVPKWRSLKKAHASNPTNPLLTTVLYFADYIQQAGSGTLEMVKQCKVHGLPEPDFVSIRNLEFKTIVTRDIYTDAVLSRIGLSDRQLGAVKFIKEKGQITNIDYQKMAGVSKATATRDLIELSRKEIIEKTGVTGRGTVYYLKVKGIIKGSTPWAAHKFGSVEFSSCNRWISESREVMQSKRLILSWRRMGGSF